MKRPLVIVGSLYGAGVVLGRIAQPALPVLFAAAIGVGVLALVWSQARAVLLSALLPLAGWTNESAHVAVLAPDDLRNLFASGPEQIAVRGTICAPPTAKIFQHGAEEVWRSSVVIEVEDVNRQTESMTAFGRLIASTPGLLDSNYFIGREITVSGIIQQPRGPAAPGLFNPRQFYRDQGIYFQLQTESTNDWRVTDTNQSTPLGRRFELWARRTLALGLPEEDEPLRLIWALALDWKAPLTPEVEQPFLRAGTYHIFAVDGLRIGLMCAIVVALLRALQIPRIGCGSIAILLVWGYVGLTGWPPSAVRAGIMMTILVLGWALRRPVDLMNSLFTAAFIILCWDPRQLFQAGFQLSFVIVFCIAILLPPIVAWVYPRLLGADPFLPDSLRKRLPDWVSNSIRYVMDILLLSWTAWLASIPLAAYYFHLFTPWSVPANFFVVPLTALALTACAGSLLFGAWLPAISILFNHSAWFFMKGIIVLSQWWASWRPGSINMAAPDAVMLAWYYLVVLPIGSGWIFKTKFKWQAWSALVVASAALVVDWNITRQTTLIAAIPTGGGSVVYIDKPRLLLDCGNDFFAGRVTAPFLQAEGLNRLPRFCLTSDHLQQIGGAQVIRTSFTVGRIDALGEVHSGNDVEGWTVLHPNDGERHARSDDDALVLRKEFGNRAVLLLSRLGRVGQDCLLQRHTNLRSDIVIASLPEKDEPLSEPLLDAIKPKMVIIVDSETPATRRASPALRNRLGRCGARVLYCRDAGALTVAIRGSTLWITDATGEVLLTTIH